ncbi:MAG: DNA replication/repair protein RecF [Bacilli bacterium]|nr:DNA replication/repair protein RecF [Bacilli bacterium]
MYIKDITLKNFRNYSDVKIEFKNKINIIYGDNAQGKTNLLESIYVLGLTKSHRSFIDNNLIKKNEKNSIICGNIVKQNISTKYEIELNKNKILKIDKDVIKKNHEYISNINIIIFYPDDLELIKGAPNVRRRFINLELSQLYSNYLVILNEYNKILKIRNDYLKNNISSIDKNYLEIITEFLIQKAVIIYRMREKFILKLNSSIEKIYFDISNIEKFNIKYNTINNIDDFNKENLFIKLKEIYNNSLEKDIKLKTTTFGPHKDDLEFYIGDYNIKLYGSQGQQRMAVLALKLAEIEIFKNYKNETPILLLDDVFSELDNFKKNNLLKYIDNNIQTIITTTDLNNISDKIIKNANLINIKEGKQI